MFELDVDDGVVVTARSVADPGTLLTAEQHALSDRAVARRRADYTAGRVAARQALEELGFTPMPVTRGPAGDPQWPDGVVGSITHAGGWAMAIAAPRHRSGGVGIDLEAVSRYFPELVTEIAFDDERRRLAAMGGDDLARAAVELFAVKESIYKAFYPRVGSYFGFDAVRVTSAEVGHEASFVQALDPVYPPGRPFEVRARWFGDLVVAWLVLPPD